jgi:GAF domain-containing protein
MRTFSAGSSQPSVSSSGRLSQQAAIVELGQRALLSHDLDSVLRLAVDLLREVLDVDHAEVLHQPAAGELLVPTADSRSQDHPTPAQTPAPCGQDSLGGYTLLSNGPVFVEDLESETRFTDRRLLLDHGVVSGMSVVIQGRDTPYGVLGVHSGRRRRFTAADGDFLRSAANILGSTIETVRAVQQVDKSARYEMALAECAQALLASSGENRIQHALEALFVATEATYVFLERNIIDPELGFCSQFVAEAEDDPGSASPELDNEFWALVPWARMPTSRKSLENGRPVVIIPEQLESPEYEQYAADPYPVKSELELPIFVNGEWAGLIGFSDQAVVREWRDTDVSLLTTAAKMFGAFWEREADREQLEEMNRAKDTFLAGVSHELRTPLTAVVGFGQILVDPEYTISDDERTDLLEMVVAHGADLTNIISDLLVAARADNGELKVTTVPLNLHAQAAQVLELLDRSQATHIALAGESTRAVGDPDRVRQIMRSAETNLAGSPL